MRVVQFLVGSQEGGAEEFFLKLLMALHEEGIDQLVVISPNARREKILREAGLSLLVLNFEGVIADRTSRFKMARAVKAYRPHIFMAWMNRAARRTPRIQNCVNIGRHGGYYWVKNYKNCDYIIGNAPDVVDFALQDGWPPERARLISNFGDIEPTPPLERSEFDTPDEAKLVLAMGRFHEVKAFDTLLRAMAHLPDDYYLWLAGDGGDRPQLEALRDELGIAGRVRFLGWRDDKHSLYAQADVYAMSSREEPLGNVVLEAWQEGVPVVAAESLGPRWLITHEHDGLLVPVDEEDAFAAAIQRICSDGALASSLTQNAAKTYAEKFSREAIVGQFVDYFAETYREKFEELPSDW